MASSSTTYISLLRAPKVGRISASMLLSRAAARMWSLALILFVLLNYHSAPLAGLCAFVSTAPGLVVSPLMGTLLDRNHRSLLVIFDYLLAVATLILIALLSWLHVLSVIVLVILVTINSLTTTLSSTGMRAALPLILSRDKWDRANGIDSITNQISKVVAPILVGPLLAFTNTQIALLIIACVWSVAALLLVGINLGAPNQHHHSVIKESWRGLLYLAHNPTLRGLAISVSVANLADGILTVCLPLLVLFRFGGSASTIGFLFALDGISSAISALIVGRQRTEGIEHNLYVIGILLGSAGLAVIALSTSYLMIAIGMLIFGSSEGPLALSAWGMRQRRTDPKMFGRVLAISMSLNICGQPIGSGIAGLISGWSLRGTLGLGVACAIVGALLATWLIPTETETTLARRSSD